MIDAGCGRRNSPAYQRFNFNQKQRSSCQSFFRTLLGQEWLLGSAVETGSRGPLGSRLESLLVAAIARAVRTKAFAYLFRIHSKSSEGVRMLTMLGMRIGLQKSAHAKFDLR